MSPAACRYDAAQHHFQKSCLPLARISSVLAQWLCISLIGTLLFVFWQRNLCDIAGPSVWREVTRLRDFAAGLRSGAQSSVNPRSVFGNRRGTNNIKVQTLKGPRLK